MIGRLNIQDGMFIGKEELVRFQEMIREYDKHIVSLFGYGIQSEFDFIVSKGTNLGYVQVGKGFAYDRDGNLIYYKGEDNIPYYIQGNLILNPEGSFLIGVSYKRESIEEGFVTTSKNGVITGNGTQFLKLFRSSSSSYKQNYIELVTSNGDLVFEVLQVTSDTVLTVVPIDKSGGSSIPILVNIPFRVVGTFFKDDLPSGVENGVQKKNTYIYDSCELSFKYIQNEKISDSFVLPPFSNEDGKGFWVGGFNKVANNIEIFNFQRQSLLNSPVNLNERIEKLENNL